MEKYQYKYHTWCGWHRRTRCTKSKTGFRTAEKPQKMHETVVVPVCCRGYEEVGGRCSPRCGGGCVSGVCEEPGACRCHPGYGGLTCESASKRESVLKIRDLSRESLRSRDVGSRMHDRLRLRERGDLRPRDRDLLVLRRVDGDAVRGAVPRGALGTRVRKSLRLSEWRDLRSEGWLLLLRTGVERETVRDAVRSRSIRRGLPRRLHLRERRDLLARRRHLRVQRRMDRRDLRRASLPSAPARTRLLRLRMRIRQHGDVSSLDRRVRVSARVIWVRCAKRSAQEERSVGIVLTRANAKTTPSAGTKMDGWEGEDCNAACPDGSFGLGCREACTCRNEAACDHVTDSQELRNAWIEAICLTLRRSCDDRYTGRVTGQKSQALSSQRFTGASLPGANCEHPCELGRLGDACSEQCECGRNLSCRSETGECACEAGWTGPDCGRICPAGFYGRDCEERCPGCLHGTCHHVTGECTCQPGWMGIACEDPCPEGGFGRDCSEKCSCLNGGRCDAGDGGCKCLPGWVGTRCESGKDCETQPPPLSSSSSPSSIPLITATASALLLSLLGLALLLCVGRRLHRIPSRTQPPRLPIAPFPDACPESEQIEIVSKTEQAGTTLPPSTEVISNDPTDPDWNVRVYANVAATSPPSDGAPPPPFPVSDDASDPSRSNAAPDGGKHPHRRRALPTLSPEKSAPILLLLLVRTPTRIRVQRVSRPP
ncbi:unnamed protein product [Darwinula stevensoni]|uniref:Multiple epidermal growth factor-like domains protein 10 n=1 Tax=Darwinula stevensoni TaxID=69355 RepID=A0A7R9AFV8_9CRUS|nr:unnamed protein product [Darwinula stevensoni]CAG0903681.1 unnamed protein product [Darwinula stevensoni]